MQRAVDAWAYVVALAVVLGMAACRGARYGYSPTQLTSAEIDGHAAAEEPVSAEGARGSLRIATLGIVDSVPEGARLLHVRVHAANNSLEGWTIDAHEQRVTLRVGDKREPIAASVASMMAVGVTVPASSSSQRASSTRAMKTERVDVPATSHATFDLYFPLPPEANREPRVTAIDVYCTIREGERMMRVHSAFERYLMETPAARLPRPESSYPYGRGLVRRRTAGPNGNANGPLLAPEPPSDVNSVPHAPLP